MTKAPQAGRVKTRLVPPLSPEEAAGLNICFLRDTAAAIARTTDGGRAQGVGVLYVSHRQEEVFALADRITVLRDGKLVWTKSRSEVERPGLIAAMVGREYAFRAPKQRAQ